jgi:hypothetical protein
MRQICYFHTNITKNFLVRGTNSPSPNPFPSGEDTLPIPYPPVDRPMHSNILGTPLIQTIWTLQSVVYSSVLTLVFENFKYNYMIRLIYFECTSIINTEVHQLSTCVYSFTFSLWPLGMQGSSCSIVTRILPKNSMIPLLPRHPSTTDDLTFCKEGLKRPDAQPDWNRAQSDRCKLSYDATRRSMSIGFSLIGLSSVGRCTLVSRWQSAIHRRPRRSRFTYPLLRQICVALAGFWLAESCWNCCHSCRLTGLKRHDATRADATRLIIGSRQQSAHACKQNSDSPTDGPS